MKTYLECTDLAAREIGDTGFKNWLIFKLDAEQLEHLERAAVIYTEQSNSHKPVVGGPVSDVRSEGEQLGNEGSAKSVRVDECDHNIIESTHGYYCSKCNKLV